MNYKFTNKEKLIDYFRSSIKDPTGRMIGLELEHFIIDNKTKKTLSYYGENGIESILKKLMPYYQNTTISQGHLIGLSRENIAITLEPGGQVETSIGPCNTVLEIEKCYQDFLDEIMPILKQLEASPVSLGYHPKSKCEDVDLIPKERYKYMDKYFKNTGKHGINMMLGTASTQVSLDYISEEDFKQSFHIANALSPILSLLTDNTPIFQGEIFKDYMARTMVWNDVDEKRSMVVKDSLDYDFGFAEYAEYILNNPCILAMDDNDEPYYTGDTTVSELYKNKELTVKNIEHVISMFFPDVRLKSYIEIRMADSLPLPYALSYTALLIGLFYNDENKNQLYSITKDVTNKDVDNIKKNLMTKGFSGEYLGYSVEKFLLNLFNMAKNGLPENQHKYLIPFQQLVTQKKTLAEVYKEGL